MRLIIAFFIVLLPELAINFAKAEEIPVLLMLKRSEQVDTLGCNFVQELTAKVYEEIVSNRIKLWDSQKKEIQIIGSTLKEIEKHSKVTFTELETVFLYEMWDNNRKEIQTRTLGISFVHLSNTNEEVAFGYVDYKDLNELFLRTKINTNANGVYSSTYASYMLSKLYIYNIVQFGGKAVKNSTESEELKSTYVRDNKFNESLVGYYPPDKYVNYILDTYTEGTDKKSVNSRNTIKRIEEFFLHNQEVFFNLGGDRITSYLQKNKIKVTRVEVNEIWKNVGNSIVYDPRSLVIYVNDSALNELTPRLMKELTITIDDKDLYTFFRMKDFNFIITKINSQTIKRKDAFLYYKALSATEWNKVIQYVINY